MRWCQLAETLGGETRDSGPEMVGGSWEGGFREERSGASAPRCVPCVMGEDCVILTKEVIMMIGTLGRNTLVVISQFSTGYFVLLPK